MQNSRTELFMKTYNPQLSIVVYKSETDYYLESHDINEKGQIMEGKPLKQETIQAIVDVFFNERLQIAKITGMMPENMLSFAALPGGESKMLWYRPAEVRVIHFAKQLKLPIAKCWVPAMLYMVQKNSLSVFALPTNTRPKEHTKIFMAPFHNVGDSGIVCLGNATIQKPKIKTYANIMQYWEDLFWLSEFTHLNGSNKTVSDLNKVWKKLIASKTKLKWSEMKELKPLEKLTLQHFLKLIS